MCTTYYTCMYVGAFVGTASEDIRSGAPKVSMYMYMVYIIWNKVNNNLVVIDFPPLMVLSYFLSTTFL